MDNKKTLDFYKEVIAALLCDVQSLHSEAYTARDLRLDLRKLSSRISREGLSFLTKTLPRLGKAFDTALLQEHFVDSYKFGFKSQINSELPRFLGKLFNKVFSSDGRILPTPCVTSIKHIRSILFIYYKLEVPNTADSEQAVIDAFIECERELVSWNEKFQHVAETIENGTARFFYDEDWLTTIRIARDLIRRLFCNFDPSDIHPKHGPGAVSTRERLWDKYVWMNVSPRIQQSYPFEAYFMASNGHVCDEYDMWIHKETISSKESSARVVLVPKDSRGPRLISCEPLDFQWVQQGLSKAIVQLVEKHPLTRYNIHFTNQQPNQFGALLGSIYGRYATLDLKEASDRISIGLVRLLFPDPLCEVLMNCRSLSTELPGGEILKLNKFAPMGSALCFPIMAICIWALLTAGIPDTVSNSRRRCLNNLDNDTVESILVYGDDIIVPTAKAENAMTLLESFGLAINRNKSCATGFFRESCGVDAFKGINVTPVRLRTVWDYHKCPNVYTSYIAYANAMYERAFYQTYHKMVDELLSIYREIPERSQNLSAPSLIEVPRASWPKSTRTNADLQKLQWKVFDVQPVKRRRRIGGWKMLLRFFAESTDQTPLHGSTVPEWDRSGDRLGCKTPLRVDLYTERYTSRLVKRWR
jgi:hypothetical protein